MKRFFRNLIVVLVVAVFVVGGISVLNNQATNAANSQPAQKLETAEVTQADLNVTVTGTGTLSPLRQVPLIFEATGNVTEILVSVGDRVAAGDVLARLDTSEVESLLNEAQIALDLQLIAYEAATAAPRDVDIAVAEAALNSAQSSASASYNPTASQQIEIARIQAEIARNRLWQAQLQRDLSTNQTGGFGIDLGSLIPDANAGDIPQEIIDQANAALAGLFPSQPAVDPNSFNAGLNQAEYGVAIADANYDAQAGGSRADIASLAQANAAIISAQVALDRLRNGASESELAAAQISVEQARLAVEQAQLMLARASLVAPFDGVIAQHNLVVGEPPPAQLPAILLIDDSVFRVDLAVDETDIVDVALDQPVMLRFDALSDTVINGRVTRISITPIIMGRLVTYPIQVTVDPTEEILRIGMTATATIIVDEMENTLVLPNRFIRIDRSTQQAFVSVETRAGIYEELPVTLGLRNETQSQIIDGVTLGQQVVLIPRASFDPITGQ